MTPAGVLARVKTAGIRLRADGERLIAAPRERLTEELRALIRTHKAALLAALQVREPAHAHGPAEHPEPATGPSLRPAPDRGTDCVRCANLTMRAEIIAGTRRIYWWRCGKGHALLEGRNFGERVLLAPPECDAAADFEQWQEGRR